MSDFVCLDCDHSADVDEFIHDDTGELICPMCSSMRIIDSDQEEF